MADSLIRRWPCDSCGDNRLMDAEAGFWGCARSYAGDRECSDFLEALEVAERLAPQAAALINSVPDTSKRRALALHWADGFADMLDLQHRGTEFDTDAFLRSCNVHVPAGVA